MTQSSIPGKPIDEKAKEFTLDLVKLEKAPNFIVEKLVANGYDYIQSVDYVYPLIESLEQKAAEKGKKNATLDIALGGLILLVGLAVTIGSKIVIAYGAIIYGGIRLVRGIMNVTS